MTSIRAVMVDPELPERLAIKEVEAPQAGPSEALVQVDAISLNRGDTLGAMRFPAGWRPGWDIGWNRPQTSGEWGRAECRKPGIRDACARRFMG